MTVPALSAALFSFHQDLDRAQHLIRLVKCFKAFAGSETPEEIKGGTVVWTEAQDLMDIAPAVRTDLPILAGSLLLYVCGRFEYFVRELVVGLADDLSARAATYVDLPERLRRELFLRTLEVAMKPERYRYDKSDAEQLVIGLAAALDGKAGSPTIKSEMLTLTESNMRSDLIAELLKRVDIVGIWDNVAKQAPLKSHLEKAGDPECRSEVTSRLDGIMNERNGVAHPTSTTSFPDVDQVDDHCNFFKVLAQTLVDVLQVPR